MKPLFQDHGLGVGLRPSHYGHFKSAKPASVSWVEALTENYLSWDALPLPRPRQHLLEIRRNIPVALHGVSMSLGSTDPLNPEYLKSLRTLVEEVEPLWVSDHLCWTSFGGENLHDLLPLPYTQEAVAHVVDRIRRVQDFLGRRILIENVSSYAEFTHSEMPEWEFLSEITRQADCGILLDVNNIFVSSVNHRFDPIQYLKGLPRERIGQIHLAGHSDNGSHLIDTHDRPVSEPVWDLYRWTVRHLGEISAMIEWDAEIPEFHVLEAELFKALMIRNDEKELHAHVPASFAFRDSISF